MKNDPDFSEVKLKCNASGSWMNVLTCKTDDIEAVQQACLTLAKAARSRLKFTLSDANGGELFKLDSGLGPVKWRGK